MLEHVGGGGWTVPRRIQPAQDGWHWGLLGEVEEESWSEGCETKKRRTWKRTDEGAEVCAEFKSVCC